tara:strand:- start:779 stop:1240 length:462 start_codon:yes stop_codon:yes gene_type:complete
MENIISFNTRFGWISIFENKNFITKIQFKKEKNKGKKSKKLKKIKKNIILYFKNKKKIVDARIKLEGKIVEKKIWRELRKIRKGRTKSYGEIAKKFKISPRYVGRVCGKNQHILVIPCHRVLKSDGTLGGFSAPGRAKLKKKLLKFEGYYLNE